MDVDDNGRLWIDSDDNQIYILTAFAGPTWTPQTAASSIAVADPTFTLQNTDEEDNDGGRQSRFVSKGEQSGGEVTTLGFTEFSHDGAVDDEKGKWRVVLNSGSEGNSPTNVPIEYTADGKIKVSTSLSVLDEDDLTSDGDKVLATQQSIKAYVDDEVNSHTGSGVTSTTTTDSGSDTMEKAHAYLAQVSGFVHAHTATGNTDALSGFIDNSTDPAGAGDLVGFDNPVTTERPNMYFFVPKDMFFELTHSSQTVTIRWTPLEAGGGNPIDQD